MTTAQVVLFLLSFFSTVVILALLVRSHGRQALGPRSGGRISGNHGSPTDDRV